MKNHFALLILTFVVIMVFVACSNNTNVNVQTSTSDTTVADDDSAYVTEGEYNTEIAILDPTDNVITENNTPEVTEKPTTNNSDTPDIPDEEVTYEIIEEPTLPINTNEPIELPFIPVE